MNKPNNAGETPLYEASRYGKTAVVDLLIHSKDINVNKPTNAGYTPLSVASRRGKTEIVNLIKRTGQSE